MTSQGIPFFLAGEEFARSKDGDENSYAILKRGEYDRLEKSYQLQRYC